MADTCAFGYLDAETVGLQHPQALGLCSSCPQLPMPSGSRTYELITEKGDHCEWVIELSERTREGQEVTSGMALFCGAGADLEGRLLGFSEAVYLGNYSTPAGRLLERFRLIGIYPSKARCSRMT